MRMWLVDPTTMCVKHLNAEHLEMHMFVGAINKGKSVKGYIEKEEVELHSIKSRHDVLAAEMKRRGYNHVTEMDELNYPRLGHIPVEKSDALLRTRCPQCRAMKPLL